MPSPGKHVTVVTQQPPQLQIQPPILSQQVRIFPRFEFYAFFNIGTIVHIMFQF